MKERNVQGTDKSPTARRRVRSDARRPKYADLYFGMADSRNEAAENPDEFVKSYVDLNAAVRGVTAGSKFLVMGPKGTGKSALAWYLALTEKANGHLTDVKDASSLPLAEIPRLQTGQPAGAERTVVAWKFILLSSLLELILRDQGSSAQRDPEVIRVAHILRDFGFMSDASGRALTTASKSTITIPIPGLGQIYKRESGREINIYNLLPYLERWVSDNRSSNRHVLVLDGLDSILLNDPKYDESLASLIQAAYQLNQGLTEDRSSGTVTLLLRNDIFARIALKVPDSQKMQDDLSVDLDWRVLSGSAGVGAPLIRLVNAKAARACGLTEVDVLSYFGSITVGGRTSRPQTFPVLQYFLNLTRHTPRDLLRLLEEIRKVEAAGTFASSALSTSGGVAAEVVREGVVQYSTKYFVNAIRNELAGNELGVDAAQHALRTLRELNSQRFDRDEFRVRYVEGGGEPDAVDRMLELLFFAGAIGNSSGLGARSYMQFYHRRNDAEVYLRGAFILHNALIHAWNLQRTPIRDRRVGARRSRKT
jgi:hypothetical protein